MAGSQLCGERKALSLSDVGFVPLSGAAITRRRVVVHASATDDRVVCLPDNASALLGGRCFAGIFTGDATTNTTYDAAGVSVQVSGVAVAELKTNTACTIGDLAGYEPSSGGIVEPVTPANFGRVVIIGRFDQSKASSASLQDVGIRLNAPMVSRSGGALYVRTSAGSSHTNTVAETTLDSYAIPAGTVQKAGTRIHVVASGRCSATHTTDTLVVKLYWGATQIGATPTLDVADGDIWHIDEYITVRTAGGAGTLLASGDATIGASSQATGAVELTAVDFTAANTLYVKGTWSAADPGNVEAIQAMIVTLED